MLISHSFLCSVKTPLIECALRQPPADTLNDNLPDYPNTIISLL